jgi:protein-tyrosine phosphatase
LSVTVAYIRRRGRLQSDSMDSAAKWPHDALLHAWWVKPGRLLAGEYPGARTAEKTAKKLQLLIDAGIDTIVDLARPEDHLEPYREALRTACERVGLEIRYFAHPIPDMDVLDQAGYDRILARIRGEMDSGRVVYVHCWGGKGRTSTVIGCLLIDGGMDYDAAIARIAELRAETRKAIDACPESPSQHRLLRERAARRRR